MDDQTTNMESKSRIEDLAVAIADATTADDAFYAAETATMALVGHRMFTINMFDAANMEVARLYSNDHTAYPIGGRKQKRDTAWGRHVLLEGKPYIGYDAEDIRQNFHDHELILGLGLESVINIPIRRLGTTVGTMNLLHDKAFYSESHIGVLRVVTGLLSTVVRTDR